MYETLRPIGLIIAAIGLLVVLIRYRLLEYGARAGVWCLGLFALGTIAYEFPLTKRYIDGGAARVGQLSIVQSMVGAALQEPVPEPAPVPPPPKPTFMQKVGMKCLKGLKWLGIKTAEGALELIKSAVKVVVRQGLGILATAGISWGCYKRFVPNGPEISFKYFVITAALAGSLNGVVKIPLT